MRNFVYRHKPLKELEYKENLTNRHVARFNESLSQRKFPTISTSKLIIPINLKDGPKLQKKKNEFRKSFDVSLSSYETCKL